MGRCAEPPSHVFHSTSFKLQVWLRVAAAEASSAVGLELWMSAAPFSAFVRSFPQMEIEQSEVFGLAFAAERGRGREAVEATGNEYPNVIYIISSWHSDDSQVL